MMRQEDVKVGLQVQKQTTYTTNPFMAWTGHQKTHLFSSAVHLSGVCVPPFHRAALNATQTPDYLAHAAVVAQSVFAVFTPAEPHLCRRRCNREDGPPESGRKLKPVF